METRRLLRLTRTDRDSDEEIHAHLAIEMRQRIDAGDAPEAARLNAAKDFGNIALVKEVTRAMWTFTSLERLWQDTRYALRGLRRSFGFTLLALAALALGIGSTTAMFTVLYSVVIRPLPFPDSDRLVALWEKPPLSERQNVVSLFNFRAWKERARSFESMAAYNQGAKNLLGGDEPIQITGANVTADFFRVLRVEPAMGRGFAPGEDGPSSPPLAVLSHGFWQRRFGGQASVLGRRISIAGTHHEIIGVLPQDFAFPNRRVDVFTSLRAEYSGRDFNVVARLRRGRAGPCAAEMVSIALVTAAERPGLNAGYSATVTPLHEQTVRRIRPLQVLFATVLFVLLIACANVANLLMRALGGSRNERTAGLGAGRWRLAHQLTVESLLLASAGGILGTFIATWGLRALLASLPPISRCLHPRNRGRFHRSLVRDPAVRDPRIAVRIGPGFPIRPPRVVGRPPKRISFRVAAPPPFQQDHGCHGDCGSSRTRYRRRLDDPELFAVATGGARLRCQPGAHRPNVAASRQTRFSGPGHR